MIYAPGTFHVAEHILWPMSFHARRKTTIHVFCRRFLLCRARKGRVLPKKARGSILKVCDRETTTGKARDFPRGKAKNGRGGEDSDNNSHNQLIKNNLQLQNIPQKSARFVSRFVTQFLIKKT